MTVLSAHRHYGRPAALTAAVGSLLLGSLLGSPGAASASAHPATTAHSAHPFGEGAPVRSYDTHMLARTNNVRADHSTKSLTMNKGLWNVAKGYAHHLARTGVLRDNPGLVSQVNQVCPHWTSLGENVADGKGEHSSVLFSAYMHSPPHRANVLDSHYVQVGVASVNGSGHREWNVMVFANHC